MWMKTLLTPGPPATTVGVTTWRCWLTERKFSSFNQNGPILFKPHGNHNFILWFSFHSENFLCVSCKAVVDRPNTRIQLEVFLSSSLTNCTLKVKVRTVSLFYMYFSINMLMSTVW